MNRREFLHTTAAALGGPLDAQQKPQKPMVGIQVGAVSFLDEGTDRVLDILVERAHVNTLFVAVFTYGRGIAGRQVPGQPLPDHGKQEYDTGFRGGNFCRVHEEFYRNTSIKGTRSPDHGDYDVLEDVIPKAHKRGLKVIAWLEDVWRGDLEGIHMAQERELSGRNSTTLCFNNPDHTNFLLGLVEDYARSYKLDGLMWGSERQGALSNALGASHGGASNDPARVTCFCRFCEAKARKLGIRFDRVREGYQALEQFVRSTRGGARPVDGAYVTFWRLILKYPEILAWEQFWHDSLRETYKAIYQKVKAAKSDMPVGWHIWHNNSFNPIYRAEQDIKVLSEYSDFLKIVMYHNCGGERMAGYIDSVTHTLFGDLSKDDALDFNYRVMNFREKPYRDIPRAGLSADYVRRETQRALAAAAGTATRIWPGIDIDIPTDLRNGNSRSTPEGTKAAVKSALEAGAPGVLLSRKYSEMRLANLSAAGGALKELGLA